MILRAASGIAKLLDADRSYVVVCGKGNNGGDGFCLADILYDRGAKVSVVYLADVMTEAEKYYYEKCLSAGVRVEKFDGTIPRADVIIDCVFGIGFRGELKGEYLASVQAINQARSSGTLVYSVDVPSGLNADNGLAEVCVEADKTFVIGAYKTGLFLNKAKDVVGEKVFVDIDIKAEDPIATYCEKADFIGAFPMRKNYANKYDYGFIGVMGGSVNYSGAAKLCNVAACAASSGAGVVRLIVGESFAPYVAPYLLESTLFTVPDNGRSVEFSSEAIDEAVKRLAALSVGMGMTDCDGVRKTVLYLLETFKGDLIIDADGLNSIKNDTERLKRSVCRRVVITPHTGEFARLTGKTRADIDGDPISVAKGFASEFGVIVLLKGTTTVVTDGKEVLLIGDGYAGQATAGSGDVLSGVISAFCGYMQASVKTVALAAYVCNRASVIAGRNVCATAFTASDTVSGIKSAINELCL